MKKTKKSNSKKPSFKPDVIEEDICKLFSKEWLRNAVQLAQEMVAFSNLKCGLIVVGRYF